MPVACFPFIHCSGCSVAQRFVAFFGLYSCDCRFNCVARPRCNCCAPTSPVALCAKLFTWALSKSMMVRSSTDQLPCCSREPARRQSQCLHACVSQPAVVLSAGYSASQLFGQGVSYTYDDVIMHPGHISFGAHEVWLRRQTMVPAAVFLGLFCCCCRCCCWPCAPHAMRYQRSGSMCCSMSHQDMWHVRYL